MNWKKYFFLNIFCFAANIVMCGLVWAIFAYYGTVLNFAAMTSSACLMSMIMNLIYARGI